MPIATVLSSLLDFPVVQSVATVPEMDISNKGTVSASVTCRVIYVSPREAVWKRLGVDVSPLTCLEPQFLPVSSGAVK